VILFKAISKLDDSECQKHYLKVEYLYRSIPKPTCQSNIHTNQSILDKDISRSPKQAKSLDPISGVEYQSSCGSIRTNHRMGMAALLTTGAITLAIPILYTLRGHTPGHEKWMKDQANKAKSEAKSVKRNAKKMKGDVKSAAGTGHRRECQRDGHRNCRCRECMSRSARDRVYSGQSHGVRATLRVTEPGPRRESVAGSQPRESYNWNAQDRTGSLQDPHSTWAPEYGHDRIGSQQAWRPDYGAQYAGERDWSRSNSVASPQLLPGKEGDWSQRQVNWRQSPDSMRSWNGGSRSVVNDSRW
jgi:hypothetical protein